MRRWPLLPAIVLILAVLSIILCPRLSSSQNLVKNPSFEQSELYWTLGLQPAQNVQIVNDTAKSGLHSLRISGQGEGLYQELPWTSITSFQSTTWVQFHVRLERLNGQKYPQALFQVYFLPKQNWQRYRVEIVVTADDTEDTQGPAIDRSPGNVSGKVEYDFNRTPLNQWVSITLDLSNVLKTFFPDYFCSRVTGILLGNSEGGRVYYDNISVISSSSPSELPSFVYYLLADTSQGHVLSALAGVFGFFYTVVEVTKFLWKGRKQSGTRKK